MADLELTILVEDDERVVIRNQDGTEAKGKIVFSNLNYNLLCIFEDWLRENKISKRQEFETFGALLYQTVFNGEVKDFFEQTLHNLLEGDRLHIHLSFQKGVGNKLISLPWEFLYCPETVKRPGFFMSTSVDLVFSRHIKLERGKQALEEEVEETLRILIAISQPQDISQNPPNSIINPDYLEQPVISAIEELGKRYPKRVKFSILEQPTIDDLLDALERDKPHVLHFVGHGHFNKKEQKGEIALLKPDKQSALWIRYRDFAEFFAQTHAQERHIPRLVFLQLCQGATLNFNTSLAELAPQLIRANVQATITMRYPLPPLDAKIFCKIFYEQLLLGEPVDHAVQVGRWRMAIRDPKVYDSRIFGTPILYMRSHDNIVQSQGL